jgi:plastocyanin
MLRPLLLLLSLAPFGNAATLHGNVEVKHASKSASGSGDVVVWLTPKAGSVGAPPRARQRLTQQDKHFTPHLLVITTGTEIEFPNKDPYFHNVFSIYRGKPFDLGLYESGRTRSVRFEHPGVSYIFCNIHPEMSAVVVALTTPYFAVTKGDGTFSVANVPPGSYRLQLFYERASPEELQHAGQDVSITESETSPLKLQVQSSDVPDRHLNKYGEAYSREAKDKY